MAPPPPRPRRGLFWRVYLALLASLALVTFIGAGLWHNLSENPARDLIAAQGGAIGDFLPPAGAPPGQTQEAMRRLSLHFRGSVMLAGPDCRPLAWAKQGRLWPADAEARRRCLESGHHGLMSKNLRTDLPDGRVFIVRTGTGFAARHLHGLMILMFVAAIVALGAYPVVGALTRRLERLRGSVEAWGEGRPNARAAVDGHDEIAAVAAAFNAAADRNAALLAAHKALLAHASHELRSPLARLRMAAELFAAKPEPALQASMNADIGELDSLVDEILLASRLDHGPDEGEGESVDVLALAAEEANRAGVEMAAAAEGPFDVTGSPRLLRRLIRNLIENAIKHGGPPVEIAVSHVAGRVVVTVSDHGSGVPDAVRERVFEPFYRPEGASEASGSWGLGLSLVRQIAERHGGSVRCEASDGLTRFVAELPASETG